MRAVTILDGQTVDVDTMERDDLALIRPRPVGCDVCAQPATRFIACDHRRFRSYRCEAHGKGLENHPGFKGGYVEVHTLNERVWLTYRNGLLVRESRGQ